MTMKIEFLQNIICCLLFSSLNLSIDIKEKKNFSTNLPLNIVKCWLKNRKVSKNYCIVVFLDTIECFYKFIRLLSDFTERIKILNLFENSDLILNKNYIYLVLKNNFNFFQIRSKFQLLFLARKLKKKCYLTLKKKKRQNLISEFFLQNYRSYSRYLKLYQRHKILQFKSKLDTKKNKSFFNFIDLNFTDSFGLFFDYLNSLITIDKIKTIIIVNRIPYAKHLSSRYIQDDLSVITNSMSTRKTLRILKKFNSKEKYCLITKLDVCKNKFIMRRIDQRSLTIIFKVFLGLKKEKIDEVKSSFFF